MQFRLRDYFYPFQIFAHHRRMREAPYWPPDRLDAWSRPRRKGLIAHAYTHVPYYRRLLDEHGIDPTRVDRDEVWRRIPLLTKDILREHAGDLTATSRFSRGAVWAGTSGSTASPLRFLLDRRVNAAAFAVFWRAWSSGGHWRLGQRQAALKGLNHPDGWRYHRAIADPGDVVGPSGCGNGTPVSRSLGALPSAFPARLPLVHVPLLPAAA
jgi:phenylacetate-coenzyme A ligase PaaK-like adenylate-forming protein